jgi:electron transport complex protein RnfE
MAASNAPTAFERFLNGILPENPVYRQLLGMCPVLAVTNGMKAAMTMAAATAFVLIMATTIISLIRNVLKPHLRILVFMLTIATFVTIADRFLAAYMYEMSKQLGPYIPLIIANCLIVGRCEVCGSKSPPHVAIMDGIGQSVGFMLALGSIASVREILGAGTWFDIRVLPEIWPDWVIMVLPPGAFLTLGVLLGLVNWIAELRSSKKRGGSASKEAA